MEKNPVRLLRLICYSSLLLVLSACQMDLEYDRFKSLIPETSPDITDPGSFISLSPTFGTNNLSNIVIDPGLRGGRDIGANAGIQSNGKIIASGYVDENTEVDFLLARFNTDGSLDTTFGNQGLVQTDVQGNAADDELTKIKVLSDDKIIAVGTTRVSGNYPIVVVKYLANGSLDTSFGTNGHVIVTMPSVTAPTVRSLDVNSTSQKILIAGGTTQSNSSNSFMVQLLPDGQLDTSFAVNGILTQEISGSNRIDEFRSAIYLADGRIAAVGRYAVSASYKSTFKSIWLADGTSSVLVKDADSGRDTAGESIVQAASGDLYITTSDYGGFSSYKGALYKLDSTSLADVAGFGTAGKVVAPTSANYEFNHVCLQGDGKIIVMGTDEDDAIYALRYNVNGSLDTSFGASGVATGSALSNRLSNGQCLVASDGSILFSGGIGSTSEVMSLAFDGGDIGVVKVTSAGVVSTSFGENGVAAAGTTYAADPIPYQIVQTVQQKDGKTLALLAGEAGFGQYHTRVLRLLANGSVDLDFGVSGVAKVSFRGDDSLNIQPGKIALQSDGKILVLGTTAMMSNAQSQLVRLHSSGLIDISFAQSGIFIAQVDPQNDVGYRDMFVTSDNKILLSGSQNVNFEPNAYVTKLTASGALDTSFANNGHYVDPGKDAGGIKANKDGSISLQMMAMTNNGYDIVIETLSSAGVHAASFVIASMDFSGPVARSAIELDGDGHVLLADNVDATTLRLRRYAVDGTLDATFGTQGEATKAVTGIDWIEPTRIILDKLGNIFLKTDAGLSSGNTSIRLQSFSSLGAEVNFFQGVSQVEIYLHTPPNTGFDMGPPPQSLEVGLDGAVYFGQIQGNDDTVVLRRFIPPAN